MLFHFFDSVFYENEASWWLKKCPEVWKNQKSL